MAVVGVFSGCMSFVGAEGVRNVDVWRGFLVMSPGLGSMGIKVVFGMDGNGGEDGERV